MAIDMNNAAVWVLNYLNSEPGLENCMRVHFLGAIEGKAIEQLQDRFCKSRFMLKSIAKSSQPGP